MTKRAWVRRRTVEIAQEMLSHNFYDLGPHMQLMCYLRAEQDYGEMKCRTIPKSS